MTSSRAIGFYLDFVSPYSWLALTQAEAFAAEHGVRWELHPIVYAALLDAHGLTGPVETPAKRSYTFQDVARCAHRLGVRLVGPPVHPFRSLEALRTLYAFRGEEQAVALAVGLANACWRDGKDLTSLDVIRGAVADAGLSSSNLQERIASDEVKRGVRELTEGAVRRGVFGVPTFVWGDELFWGHDRLGHLAARLAGTTPPAHELVGDLLTRPRGVDRARR